MKTLILISAIIFTSMSLKANAQCCQPEGQQLKTEQTTQQEPKTVKLKITGMTCAGCSKNVFDTLQNTIGVLDQSVEYPGDLATINYDSAKTKPEELIKVIEKLGYQAQLMNKNN